MISPMPNLFLEKSVEIAKPAIDVWQAFVDPARSRAMGGEYVSEWEPGASIAWKDAEGRVLKRGRILKIEPAKLLKHNLTKEVDGVETMTSVVTYEFRGRQDGKTTLSARESFAEAQDAKAFADASAAWDAALAKLKDAVESA